MRDMKGAAYSKTPLAKKLGIKDGFTVALLGAPAGFEALLEPLPPDIRFRRRASGRCDLALWFVTRRKTLDSRIEKIAAFIGDRHLWICWPKKASGIVTDFSEQDVRQAGLDWGLVDFKIAATTPPGPASSSPSERRDSAVRQIVPARPPPGPAPLDTLQRSPTVTTAERAAIFPDPP